MRIHFEEDKSEKNTALFSEYMLLQKKFKRIMVAL